MNKPRLTAAVRRGLQKVWSLAYSDVQAAEEEDFTKAELDQIERALEWVRFHAYAEPKGKAARGKGEPSRKE